MAVIIETLRLTLSRFTENDAPLIQQLNSDYDVVKYLHEPILETVEKAKQILEDVILPQYKLNLGRWVVYTKEGKEFIGWCGLKYRQEAQEIDLGYRFIKSSWGKGYATEAAKAALQYGHQNLKLEKIIAHAHIDNIASQKILEKIGMQYVGEGMDDGEMVKGYVSFSNNI